MGRVHKKKIAEYVAASENEEKNDVDSDAAVSEDEAVVAEAEESGEDLTAEPEPDTPEKEAAKKLKKRHAESGSDEELNGTSSPKRSKKAAGKGKKGKKAAKPAAKDGSEAEDEANGDDQDEAESEVKAPAKKQRGRKAAKSAAKEDSEDDANDDDQDEEAESEVKASTKKQKAKKGAKAAAKEDSAAEDDANNGDDAEEPEYEVKEVVDHKVEKGVTYYLIRWKGYTADDDTWEAAESLSCADLIEKYKKKSAATSKKSKTKAEVKNKPGPKSKTKKGGDKKKAAENPDQEWEVDKILDYAEEEDGRLFRIRWKGYSAKHDTWEPEEHLHCEDIIAKFMKRMKAQENVSVKELREEPKKTKRLVSETTSRARFYAVSSNGDRKSKRKTGNKRVFYGNDDDSE